MMNLPFMSRVPLDRRFPFVDKLASELVFQLNRLPKFERGKQRAKSRGVRAEGDTRKPRASDTRLGFLSPQILIAADLHRRRFLSLRQRQLGLPLRAVPCGFEFARCYCDRPLRPQSSLIADHAFDCVGQSVGMDDLDFDVVAAVGAIGFEFGQHFFNGAAKFGRLLFELSNHSHAHHLP